MSNSYIKAIVKKSVKFICIRSNSLRTNKLLKYAILCMTYCMRMWNNSFLTVFLIFNSLMPLILFISLN